MQVTGGEHQTIAVGAGESVLDPQLKCRGPCLGCNQYFPQLKLGPFVKHRHLCVSNISKRQISCSPSGVYTNSPPGNKKYPNPFFSHSIGQTDELKAPLQVQAGKLPVKCQQCNKNFACKSRLVIHLRTHTGEKPFSCKQCHKRFSHKSHLERHQRIHTGEKPYTCKQCGKRFADNSNLITHRNIHMSERPFKCQQCDRRFAQKVHLRKHQCTHTGARP